MTVEKVNHTHRGQCDSRESGSHVHTGDSMIEEKVDHTHSNKGHYESRESGSHTHTGGSMIIERVYHTLTQGAV